MNRFRPHILLIITLLLAPMGRSAVAQSLPKMKQAEEVTSGVLPNGISYYLVENPYSKGKAHFSLIQEKDGADRACLENLDHLSPKDYLLRKGVGYTPDGFIKFTETKRIFTFPDIEVGLPAVADSTMLMMFDLVNTSAQEQTIIICGDINRAQYKTMLATLGLTVNKLKTVSNLPQKVEEGSVVRVGDASEGFISFTIKLASVTREQANTPVPLVSELLARELSLITIDRIRDYLRSENIPFYLDFTTSQINIHVPESLHSKASTVIGDVFADISLGRVSLEEFRQAKKIALEELVSTGLKQGKSNQFYTDKCISAACNGTNLASEAAIRNFFTNRKITPEREHELFLNFATALYGQDWDAPTKTRQAAPYPIASQVFSVPASKPTKIAITTPDPVTGGSIWTFENGIKVLYKYDKTAQGFNFCLAQRGGASSISDLQRGESAYLSKMLEISRIAGLDGETFLRLARSEGISLDYAVNLEDMRISGHAPSGSIASVLKILYKIAYEREVDAEMFDYVRRCEQLASRTSPPSVFAVMDSLICPDYAYHRLSSAMYISDSLPYKAERYFSERFENVSDGMFIIIGNIPENELRDALSRHLSLFRTSRKYALRTKVPYTLNRGRSTHVVKGENRGVNVAATALMTVNLENNASFLIARELVQKRLNVALAPLGYCSDISGRVSVAPVERFSIYISCAPCERSGLPRGVSPAYEAEVLRALRALSSDIATGEIPAEEFKSVKTTVKGRLDWDLSTPEGKMEHVLWRYIEGKDLTSSFAKKIDAIKPDDIRWVLEELFSSGMVEYIIM